MATTYEAFTQAQSDVNLLQGTVTGYQLKVLEYQKDVDMLKYDLSTPNPVNTPRTLANAERALAKAQADLDAANSQLQSAQSIVNDYWSSGTTNAEATTPTVTSPTTASPNTLTGSANEDTGNQNTSTSSPTTYYENDGTPSSSNILPPNAGTTVTGKSGSPAATSSTSKPGKRLKNPLGNFASYTYQISLYMITPDAYDAFVQSGRRKVTAINSSGVDVKGNGAFLVAQSGGINPTSGVRAPEMKLDYYIDDLRITATTSPKATATSTNIQNITFNVIEPYGFSFISQLRNAADVLKTASKSKNYNSLNDPTRQFFILGIRFQGYDINGNPITGKETFAGDTFDPSGNSNGVFERFYDIQIRSLKFKVDGKATVYNIVAANTGPAVSLGIKRGILDRGAKVVATTVDEALMGNDPKKGVLGLLTKLNNDELVRTKQQGIPNKYSVEWLGNAKALIGDQTIVSKADLDKSKFAMSNAKTTIDSNDALSEEAVPNTNKRQITFRNGTPILQAIGLIIAQSSFLEKALKAVYTTAKEPPPKTDAEAKLLNSQTRTIRWYNLSTQVKCLGWDKTINDFSYDIKFLIQPYETPIALSAFAKTTPKYYGPVKSYEYWYTGKNSEIISYEQTVDNTYMNVVVNTTDQEAVNKATGGAAQIPIAPGKQSGQPTQGKTTPGMEAQNSYLASLFDPGSWGNAKLQILGDPDLLMTESVASSTNESYVYNQFYGVDGYTINPNGGQVFIEIDFKQAIDYDNGTGLMSLNDRILTVPYPPTIARMVKGISYQLTHVTSSFSKGKFVQDLTLLINSFDGLTEEQAAATAVSGGRENESAAETARLARLNAAAGTKAPNSTGTSTSGTTGMVQDDVTGLQEAYDKQDAINQASAYDLYYDSSSASQVTAPTGTGNQVNNDDAVNSNNVKKLEESGRE